MSNLKKDANLAKNKRFDITKFEALEVSGKVAKGGFSTALTSVSGGLNDGFNLICPKNNCDGGNCISGCGTTTTS